MIKLQLKPGLDGLRVREAPITGKPIAQIYATEEIESLESPQETRSKLEAANQWIKIRTKLGIDGFTAGWMLTLAEGESWPEEKPAERVIAVRPTVSALRIRNAPVTGDRVAVVGKDDVLIVLEDEASFQARLGVEDQWIKVKTIYGQEGFTAAWYVEAYDGPIPEPEKAPTARSLLGMNLDLDHAHGKPTPEEMKTLGWVRIKFNVSFDPRKHGDARYGNTDVDYTYSRYIDAIKQYTDSGLKVLMVLTHQAFGEGAGYNWEQMSTERWRDLTGKYANMARRIAEKFAGTGLISVYQIWNEQDTKPEHARAAVPIGYADYAHLLAETIKAIRSVDKTVKIITGGHVGGPQAGADYARKTIAAMPADIRPDGIAFHPYGRGVAGHEFSIFGPLDESIQNYSSVMPGKPVWITEWGVLNAQGRNDLAGKVADYSRGFMNICTHKFPGQVGAAIWYAWADGMDNGYGFVNFDGSPKQPLYGALLR